ncbi:DUF1254 domain-containing protein [Candidatus Eisenbacteria bacterium]|uniref:DUF1254 domain-containing protein n=1 Tax=Eiseniibacteriota bacterium TaxID=2212470 RepID=A0ABV6YPD9_UNCEI
MTVKLRQGKERKVETFGRAILVILALVVVITGCSQQTQITPEEARETAREAYVYGFPMVMNCKTIYNYVVDESSPDYKGPFNQKACAARLFTPEDKAVVTPNADTPYCMFWMDLRVEPMILTVPEMEPDRFYHFQFIDLYTHNFDYVGTLATGNDAGKFLIAGPDWNGKTPEGIAKIVRSETDFVFNVTRTQLFGPDDLERVKAIQQSYDLQPLSAFLGTEAPPAAPMPDFPEWNEGSQFDEHFYGYLDFMLTLLKEPGDGEQALWDRLARLGIGPEGTFDFDALPSDIQDAMKAGRKDGFDDIEEFLNENTADPLVSAKIFGTREFLSESAMVNYDLETPTMLRAVAAHMGLYGNSAAEAIYPTYLVDSDQQPLNASTNRYTLTFEREKCPPVSAFWSLTMYDGGTQLFIDNPLDRYLLNSTMMDQFRLEADGSLIINIAKDSPGKDLEGNWLPAPDGPFYMVMRLYGPKPEALEGDWTPPVLQLAK